MQYRYSINPDDPEGIDAQFRKLVRKASGDPSQENLAKVGAMYLRIHPIEHELKIIGRRWFNKSNGTTYHTATVYYDEKLIGKTRITYGYDSQYVTTGIAYAIQHLGLPTIGDNEPPYRWAQRLNIKVVSEVDNVTRRRDL